LSRRGNAGAPRRRFVGQEASIFLPKADEHGRTSDFKLAIGEVLGPLSRADCSKSSTLLRRFLYQRVTRREALVFSIHVRSALRAAFPANRLFVATRQANPDSFMTGSLKFRD
jgi:hypothetical protein